MLFNSFEFLLVFLPATLAGFHLLLPFSQRAALWLVLVASLAFYGYWSPPYVLLILGSIAFNYAVARRILRARAERQDRRADFTLALGVAVNLAALGYFKYAAFAVETLNGALDAGLPVPEIALPLAISFFTFQQITWLVDARRGAAEGMALSQYALCVLFFPHLIAGPIVYYRELAPQFLANLARRRRSVDLAVGFTIFAIGLFKKVVLGDSMGVLSDQVFGAAERGQVLTFWPAWCGAFAYAFQIYFDFSGYSDMAIGLARLFGVRLPANFASPYKATSIADFWRRWHITLSRFLRDYLYIPLGGNRKGEARRYANLLITMLLGGLWHGASWTFVAWGGLHGLYLIVNHAWRAGRLALGLQPRASVAGQWLARLVTFLCVVVAWVFFRAPDFPTAGAMLAAMAGANGVVLPTFLAGLLGPVEALGLRFEEVGLFGSPAAVLPLAACFALVWGAPNTQQIMRRYRPVEGAGLGVELSAPQGLLARLRWRPAAASLVAVAMLAAGSVAFMFPGNEKQFIYFQF